MESVFNDKATSQNRSALLRAVASENIEKVRSLISAGADVNAFSRWDFIKAIKAAPEDTAQFLEDYLERDSPSIFILTDENEFTAHPSVLICSCL